jgi:hypothetical protein
LETVVGIAIKADTLNDMHVGARPLSEVDTVPWAKLTHAYGKAVDVPDQLRALSSSNEQDRWGALHVFYGNIFHQGSRYSASTVAIPFLLGLLDEEPTKDKDQILILLNHLAVGYHSEFLAEGFAYTSPGIQRLYRGRAATADRGCYEAVRTGGEIYQRLLDHPAAEVRAAAAFVLAFIREHAERSAALLRDRVSREEHQEAKSSMVLALGLLDSLLGTHEDRPVLRRFLAQSSSPVLSLCASIGLTYLDLAGLPDEAGATLSDAASIPSLTKTQLPWNDGDLVGYAAIVLQRVGGQAGPEGALRELLAVLQQVDRRTGLTTVMSILNLVFGEDRLEEQGRSGERRRYLPEDLDQRQRDALVGMVRSNGAWHYGNTGLALRDLGLPADREDLAKFLDVVPPGLHSREITLRLHGLEQRRTAFVWFRMIHDDLVSPAELAQAIVDSCSPTESIDICLHLVKSAKQVEVALEVLDLLGETAWAPLRNRAEAMLEQDRSLLYFGPPACVAIGLARLAAQRGVDLDPEFQPILRAAFPGPRNAEEIARKLLLALPVERRASLMIEYPYECWDLYPLAPTLPMLTKALHLIAEWGSWIDGRPVPQALALIVEIGPPAVPMLVESLRSGGVAERIFLAMALGSIRDDPSLHHLFSMADDGAKAVSAAQGHCVVGVEAV